MKYIVNQDAIFTVRGLCAITRPDPKDPTKQIEIQPASDFADFEAVGPGTITGDVDTEIRGRNNQVEVLPNGTIRETINPIGLQYDLYHRWFTHGKTHWNMTEMAPTGRKDESGDEVMQEVAMERTNTTLDRGIHLQHQRYLQQLLGQHFYPEFFGPEGSADAREAAASEPDGAKPRADGKAGEDADPNLQIVSSRSGTNGTDGTGAGSKRGSKEAAK